MNEPCCASPPPASNTFPLRRVHLPDMNRIVAPGWRGKSGVALVLFVALLSRAELPPAEKLLPVDTLLVVSVPEAAKLRAVYEKSPQTRFWNDPAMKPFRDKFVARWNEDFIAPLERDLGVKLDDYSSLLQGQVTFAVTQNGWTGQTGGEAEPGLLFLLDAREKSGQLKTNLTELRKKWSDAGKAVRTEKIRDVEFAIVPLSTNDLPKTLTSFVPQSQPVQELGKVESKPSEQTHSLVLGQFESLLIIASSTKAVDVIVAHLTGGNAPSLADEPAFEQNRLAQFRDANFYVWFNARAAVDLLTKLPKSKPNAEAPNPLPLPELDRILTGLGLSGWKTLSLSGRDTGDGLLLELFLGVPEAARQGLFKLLTPEAKDSNPPPFVPADAINFQRFRFDGPKTVANLEKMLKELSPQTFNSWDYMLKSGEEAMKQNNTGYDLRRDVFGNLGDDLVIYEKPPRGSSLAELDSPPSLFAVASPKAEELARALSGLLIIRSGDALKPKVREFLGKRIYSVTMPSTAGGPGVASKPDVLSYAASGGYVVFSSDAGMLEEFLRSAESPGRALRDTPGLAEAAQRVGGMSTGMFSYENQAESMRLMFELLKKLTPGTATPSGSANALVEALPFAGPEKSFREWMDFSLLPEFSKVAKYFSFTVWAGSANADGLSYKWFSPAPPGLKP